jgi:DASS family divalent anion:Na+ symporter
LDHWNRIGEALVRLLVCNDPNDCSVKVRYAPVLLHSAERSLLARYLLLIKMTRQTVATADSQKYGGEAMSKKAISGISVILVGLVLWFLPVPAGLKAESWHLFAIFVATILGFILQPLSIGSVAFISITLTAILKVLKPAEVLSGFSDTTIWLIFSAFVFTKGFTRTGLGRRISYLLIRLAGTSTLKLVYALAAAETVIAPATPSNTARCGGVIFPIARSLCSAFDSEPGPTAKRFGSYFMQAVYHNSMTSGLFITAMASNVLVDRKSVV